MIKPSVITAAAALALFGAAAFAQGGPTVEVRATMQERVNPAMLAVWDIGNNAMNDEGGLDPAQLDDAKWAELAAQSQRLAAASGEMVAATNLIIAFPANRSVGEGQTSMAVVQQLFNKDPEGFRRMAAEMASHAGKIAAAARARDAAVAGALIGEMDAVCESCHARFWNHE